MNAPTTPPTGIAHVRSWTLPLYGLTRPPITLNSRLNRWELSRRKQMLRDLTIVSGRKARVPKGLDRITVVLHWQPQYVRDRDEDNPAPTVKPCVDALVTPLGVIPRDTRAHYTVAAPVIYDGWAEPGRLWLVVIDLSTNPT